MNWLTEIMKAERRMEVAAQDKIEVSQRAFPIGTQVLVTLGRASIQATVIGIGDCHWHQPGEVFVTNNRTGKRRQFDPAFDPWEFME